MLQEDPDLAEAVAPELRARAIAELTAPVFTLPAGPWPLDAVPSFGTGAGLLVLGGVLLRRVGVEGRNGAELVGECDIVRPGPASDRLPTTLSPVTGWSVIVPARLAVLDQGFSERLSHYPALIGKLVNRALLRCKHVSVHLAIVHQARVDVRLHVLFWHLAGRWGKVRSDGTLMPLPLTHAVLGDLVAARRPTVTTALSDLSRRGLIRSTDDGWILSGEPPGELLALDVQGR